MRVRDDAGISSFHLHRQVDSFHKLAATLPHGGGGAFNNGRFSSDHTLGVSPGVLGSEGAHSNDKNVRKWPVHYTIYG